MRQRFLFFTVTLAVLTGGLMLAAVGHADQITRGQMLSVSCAGCHGTDGWNPGAIPSIRGKSVDFIVTSFKEFRAGERESTVMNRHAKGYTEEEVKLIAEYFASIR